MVDYFAQAEDKDQKITEADAYWYATGIIVTTAYIFGSFHIFSLYTMRTAGKLRVACSGMIYQKTLRLVKSSIEDGDHGKIINLLSNDLAKFDLVFYFIQEIWKGPIQALSFLVVIYLEVGWSGVIGLFFLLSFIPLQGKVWNSKK